MTAAFFACMNGHSRLRIFVAFNPYLDPERYGYTSVLAREVMRTAAWFGRGDIAEPYLTSLRDSAMYFYTNMLLTSLTALLGKAAFAAIAGALAVFAAKGFSRCARLSGGLGFFVSFAVLLTFCAQFVGYIMYNLGFQPSAPLSLPLISHGNTAAVINMALIGVMLSVFRAGGSAAGLTSGAVSDTMKCEISANNYTKE